MADEGNANTGWSGVMWLVMDQMLFHTAVEHVAAGHALRMQPNLSPRRLQYDELRHAASALSLACSAMEGHANYIAQCAIHNSMPNHLRLTSNSWDRMADKLPAEAKWVFVSTLVTGDARVLDPGKEPFKLYLAGVRLRNALIVHPKMAFTRVQLEPGVPPDAEAFDLSQFKEVAEITIENAELTMEAARGMLRILYYAMGLPQKLPDWAA